MQTITLDSTYEDTSALWKVERNQTHNGIKRNISKYFVNNIRVVKSLRLIQASKNLIDKINEAKESFTRTRCKRIAHYRTTKQRNKRTNTKKHELITRSTKYESK